MLMRCFENMEKVLLSNKRFMKVITHHTLPFPFVRGV